jgi:Contractile injection system tape measure protein
MEEYDLVLPKILCGLSYQEPVSTKSFHVSNAIKKETENMLNSVIEYWNILQNTSINGLRESFLKRDGKLSFNGGEWKLTVEQKPYDLLLDHLPWNFSMIKLPWMKHLLKTQWNY